MLTVFQSNLYEDQTEADAKLYYNDIEDPLILREPLAIKLKAADVLKEVNIQSLDVLTDSEHLCIIENADNRALATDSEESEELEAYESDVFPWRH